jgi:AcrR family transcriptional regulator
MTTSRPLRDEHRDATRLALVTSARELFAAKGFQATSLDDVAGAARVTKGAIYHHFANKQALFRSVYLTIEAEVEHASATAAAQGRSPIDAILRGTDAYLDAAMATDVQRITLIDAPAVLGEDATSDPGDNPGHIGLSAVIADAIEAGTMKLVDADCLAHLLRGGCVQAAMLIARSSSQVDTRRKVGETLHVLIEGLTVD